MQEPAFIAYFCVYVGVSVILQDIVLKFAAHLYYYNKILTAEQLITHHDILVTVLENGKSKIKVSVKSVVSCRLSVFKMAL